MSSHLHTGCIPVEHTAHTHQRHGVVMNTTQNTKRIIATAIIAVTAGLALSSCAQRSDPTPVAPVVDAQVAEWREGHLELAEERARMYRELADARVAAYAEFAQRRAQMYRELAIARGDADQPDAASSPDAGETAQRCLDAHAQ